MSDEHSDELDAMLAAAVASVRPVSVMPELGCPAAPRYAPQLDVADVLEWDAEQLTEYVEMFPTEAEGMAAVAIEATKQLRSVKLVAESRSGLRRGIRRAHHPAPQTHDPIHQEVDHRLWSLNGESIFRALSRYPEARQQEITACWQERFGSIRPLADDIHEIAAWLEKKANAPAPTTKPDGEKLIPQSEVDSLMAAARRQGERSAQRKASKT